MKFPSRIAAMTRGSFSNIWPGVAGALLCYLVAGVTSWIVYALIYLIRDDFKWSKELFAAAVGGGTGAYAGVWVLDHTLRRYPGRTIGWIFIGILTVRLSLTLLGVGLILSGNATGYKLSEIFSPMEVHEDISAVFEAITFYLLLVRLNQNQMLYSDKASIGANAPERPLGRAPRLLSDCATGEQRRQWFAVTPPWNQIAPHVTAAIVETVADEGMLKAFVLASVENGLIPRYVALGRDQNFSHPNLVIARASEFLSAAGRVAGKKLEKEMQSGPGDLERLNLILSNAINCFEVAVNICEEQMAAYLGLASLYGIIGNKDKCQGWARRGLAVVEELKRQGVPLHESKLFGPDPLGEMETAFNWFLVG